MNRAQRTATAIAVISVVISVVMGVALEFPGDRSFSSQEYRLTESQVRDERIHEGRRPGRTEPPPISSATVAANRAPEAAVQLVRRLHGTSLESDLEAISSFGDTTEPTAIQTLCELLNHHHRRVRVEAVEELGALGSLGSLGSHEEAVAGLAFALLDASPSVRRSAVDMLSDIGTTAAVAALTTTLTDTSDDVRAAAVYEIADLTATGATDLLQQFVADPESRVAQLAAAKLAERTTPVSLTEKRPSEIARQQFP